MAAGRITATGAAGHPSVLEVRMAGCEGLRRAGRNGRPGWITAGPLLDVKCKSGIRLRIVVDIQKAHPRATRPS